MTSLRWTPEQLAAYQRGKRLPGAPAAPGSRREPKEQSDGWPIVLRDQIVAAGLPVPLREACFHPTRGWRADLSWPDRRLAVELEGGAHAVRKQVEADRAKHNGYVLAGWRYLRVSNAQVKDGRALELVRELLDS